MVPIGFPVSAFVMVLLSMLVLTAMLQFILHLCMGVWHDMLYANAFVSFMLLVSCLASKQHREFT